MIKKYRSLLFFVGMMASFSLACGLFNSINQALNSDLIKKALLLARQEGPQFLATLEALATQKGPGLVETSQALIDKYPGWQATVASVATDFSNNYSRSPDDIPLIWGDKHDFYSDEITISYFTDIDYRRVIDFFDTEMFASGWKKRDDLSGVGENITIFVFEKANRRASIDIFRKDRFTSVLILVTNP